MVLHKYRSNCVRAISITLISIACIGAVPLLTVSAQVNNWIGEGDTQNPPEQTTSSPNTGTSNESVNTSGETVGGTNSVNPNVGGNVRALVNPLKFDSISGLLLGIIDILLVFALPLIVLYIMYAGYLYVVARGNPGKISEAHQALLWAVIGGVLVLGAKLIVDVVQGTVDAFK